MGHWEFPGEFDPAEWFGFIYRIIDTTNNREYIGKKQFNSYLRKPPKKGKTRRTKVVKESDWRSYTSSSTHVNDAIKEKGKEHFVFLIESLHANKSSLHYAEVENQIFEDVLRATLPSGERKYYNGMIGNIKFLPKNETPVELQHSVRQKVPAFWMNPHHLGYEGMTTEEKMHWDVRYRTADKNNRADLHHDAYMGYRGKKDLPS